MRAQISGLDQASNNVKDAISMVQTAEGALQEVQDMLNRMVTLSEESANGTYDDDVDRAALQDEVTALNDEINRIADSANFNGKKLFSATANLKSIIFQIGDTGESFNRLAMSVSLGSALVTFRGMASMINVATYSAAVSSLSKLKVGASGLINKISSLRGKLGAVQNRLEHTANNLSVMTENIQDAESTIRDTDIAEEMMSYTKNNILVQSAQAMLAQANTVPQGVLQLLQ
jgi:flagellin